jgi:hypothetical protein
VVPVGVRRSHTRSFSSRRQLAVGHKILQSAAFRLRIALLAAQILLEEKACSQMIGSGDRLPELVY